MQQILPGLKWFRYGVTAMAALAGLGALPAVAQRLNETQALQLQCGAFYGLLAEQADPDSTEIMQAYADGFRVPVETALAEIGLSEKQRSDVNAQYADPIAAALAEGINPDMALHRCAGTFVVLHAVDVSVFTTHPELHQQFTCGTAFLIADGPPSDEVSSDDLRSMGLALIGAAYETLTAAGVNDLGRFAIAQGYTVNLSQTMSSEGDGDIGFTLAECLDLVEQ